MGEPAGTDMTSATVLPPAVDPEPGWSQSLATGAPGIALLHIERARSGLGAWSAVQQWATAATRHRISAHHRASLFTGAPAVAFALHSAGQSAYQPGLEALDHDICRVTAQRLAAAHDRIDRCRLPELAEFDVISGLTGIGAYLHHRNTDQETLRAVLAYLVQLTQPLTFGRQRLPGWWTGNGPQDVPSPEWEGGHSNNGMAHGISVILGVNPLPAAQREMRSSDT
jgi:hypothetical protein